MVPGYHTAALAEHDLATAGSMLRRIGFQALGVRLSLARLDPLADQAIRTLQVSVLESGLRGMRLVLDADGPFLVDPWRADYVGIVEGTAESERLGEYVIAAIELAGEISGERGGGVVTFSVGRPPEGIGIQESLDRLASVVSRVVQAATSAGVDVALRPRTGHLVDSVAGYERLLEWIGSGSRLRFAADVGVMVAGGEMPILDMLDRLRGRLACVYLSDLRPSDQISKEPLIGNGSVSVRRVVEGVVAAAFAVPVVLEPVGAHSHEPKLVEELFEQVFREHR